MFRNVLSQHSLLIFSAQNKHSFSYRAFTLFVNLNVIFIAEITDAFIGETLPRQMLMTGRIIYFQCVDRENFNKRCTITTQMKNYLSIK